MEAWARAHADNEDAADFLARSQKPIAQQQQHAASAPTVVPTLSSYEGSCSSQSPCKWIIARRNDGDGSDVRGEIVAAMLLVYSGDTAFGLFTGLDYESSKDCRA
jgi:hypothetical protein